MTARRVEDAPAAGADRRAAPRSQAQAAGRSRAGDLLAVQRTAGNRAAAQARYRPISVQRHSSWEHTLLGDTPPEQLGRAAVTPEARKHLLASEWDRMMFFSQHPEGDPRGRFPDVRWIQLAASGLWVSNGELNALADYLPGPSVYDSLPRDRILPVLQRMRSGIRARTGAEFGLRGTYMAGMATHWMDYVSDAAGEVKSLDEASAGSGTDRYAALVSRNACHFAPFSWQRWAHFHQEARAAALAHHASRRDPVPLGDLDAGAGKLARQAILTNGYGDHFLQDSFAAGHLVNKTLVMQWWVDYLNSLNVSGLPERRGQPDSDVMRRMGSADQPGLAGRRLYQLNVAELGSTTDDREHGDGVTDPQTAQERTDLDRRIAGSGVSGGTRDEKWANYQAYLRLLNSGFIQAAAGAVHDHFNAAGLAVVNNRGDELQVGGDDTLLGRSNQAGAQIAGSAAAMSRRAVEELMDAGATGITLETIFDLVPQKVLVAGRAVPLGDWQDQVVRDLCFTTLFPQLYRSVTEAVVGVAGATMVETGVSTDQRAPVPAR